MSSRLLFLAPVLALAACTFDADGDGISNGDEKDLGMNPDLADSDGDGLSDPDEIAAGSDPLVEDTDGDGLIDGDEIANGADPLLVDTDDDGYTDHDEVFEGHDPADPKDRIYKGRWPYVFDKSVIDKGPRDFREIGETFLRLRMVDQHGEEVDLFDFYNADKPVVIDISAQWCGPCQSMASWISGGPELLSMGLASTWPNGPEAVRNGDVYWITVMGETTTRGEPANPSTPVEWEEAFSSKQIPILADQNYEAVDYVGLGYWPFTILLEPDLTLSTANEADFGSYITVLQELNNRFP